MTRIDRAPSFTGLLRKIQKRLLAFTVTLCFHPRPRDEQGEMRSSIAGWSLGWEGPIARGFARLRAASLLEADLAPPGGKSDRPVSA